MSAPQLRLAELMASLSLAIDLGNGQPIEWVMKCTLLGLNLAKAIGLSDDEQREVYYLSLLRHIGCTATAPADARRMGDETVVAEGMTIDLDDPAQTLSFVLRNVGKTKPLAERLRLMANMLAVGSETAHTTCVAQNEVAERLAGMMGFASNFKRGLSQTFERWDGKGLPDKVQGEDLTLAARIAYLARDAATFYHLSGIDAAVTMVRQRSGRHFDPTLAEAFCRHAPDLCESLETDSVWEVVLAAEPGQSAWLTDEQFDMAAQAIADFTDLKSHYLVGHSRRVAKIAADAAKAYGLPEADVVTIRRAGWLHDIGRVGVTAGIWEKPGPLTASEWEQVRLHPYFTERVLSHSRALEPLGTLAALHHERLDGSGYHRRLPASMLTPLARLLAAADGYCAMTEARPHRPALSHAAAATELRRDSTIGKFDPQTVDAVLSAAGHRAARLRRAPSNLTPREIEILRLIARGHSTKQIARQLTITEKTAENHIYNVYGKLVSRAAPGPRSLPSRIICST
ncbi:MAG: HD domain-containing protein [Chloroflexi bacterium]|nr:HD domain-containing protein [Chloroflexota bacterium]